MGWSECGIGNAECGKEGSWEDGKVGKKARLRDGETGFRQSRNDATLSINFVAS